MSAKDVRYYLQSCDINENVSGALEELIDSSLVPSDQCLLERFLVSPVIQNREVALDGLVTYLKADGYLGDVLLLHLDGMLAPDVADIVGARLLGASARAGNVSASRVLTNLSRRKDWVEEYAGAAGSWP